MTSAPARRVVILVAGPSGSGKSRLATAVGLPQLRLDDFYYPDTQPGLPCTEIGATTIIDWDNPASWNHAAAVAALCQILDTGSCQVPHYQLSHNRAMGSYLFDLGDQPAVICEGIFAPELLAPLRQAGVEVQALWLDRPRWFNFARRLSRDLAEKRKTPSVLVRRGLALLADEPRQRRVALGQGFIPVGMRVAVERLRAVSATCQVEAIHG